jgi:hypothetical protein
MEINPGLFEVNRESVKEGSESRIIEIETEIKKQKEIEIEDGKPV